MTTARMTMAQALVAFLHSQQVERDGATAPLFAGVLGIFGHGNVAGVGQALQQHGGLRYVLPRNEQAMVHTAVAYARHKNRLQTWACTSSIGPGATNMVTGAALATINRLPVLLLPGDVFASRRVNPALQQLEIPGAPDASVNDAFRPVSRFFDRINRPDQLQASVLEAMRVLTDQAETGAVTLALPQDVQAEAHDYPQELFERRVWRIARPAPDAEAVRAAAELVRGARRPLIVAGGGVIYSEATAALRALSEATGIPVAETQAGKGSLPYGHPGALGAVGATGTRAANLIARDADLVIAVGTRLGDFTTASRTAFQHPDVRLVALNVAAFDAHKLGALPLVGDARAGLEALAGALAGHRVDPQHAELAARLNGEWDAEVARLYAGEAGGPVTQAQVIGTVNASSQPTGRRRLRRRQPARRPAQAVAHARPEGLPRRVRLLVHGLRGGRRPGREDGRSRPRGDRDGRRRLVAHDVLRDRHLDPGGRAPDRRSDRQPRLRLDRRPLAVARLRGVRHGLPQARRRTASCPARRSSSTWPRTPAAWAPTACTSPRRRSWPRRSSRPARATAPP